MWYALLNVRRAGVYFDDDLRKIMRELTDIGQKIAAWEKRERAYPIALATLAEPRPDMKKIFASDDALAKFLSGTASMHPLYLDAHGPVVTDGATKTVLATLHDGQCHVGRAHIVFALNPPKGTVDVTIVPSRRQPPTFDAAELAEAGETQEKIAAARRADFPQLVADFAEFMARFDNVGNVYAGTSVGGGLSGAELVRRLPDRSS